MLPRAIRNDVQAATTHSRYLPDWNDVKAKRNWGKGVQCGQVIFVRVEVVGGRLVADIVLAGREGVIPIMAGQGKLYVVKV